MVSGAGMTVLLDSIIIVLPVQQLLRTVTSVESEFWQEGRHTSNIRGGDLVSVLDTMC
jgi:hypothetical protein